MNENINETLTKYNLLPITSLNEAQLQEVSGAMRQIAQHWEKIGLESVLEYNPEKLKMYKAFTGDMYKLQAEFKFTQGTQKEIDFWYSLTDKRKEETEYMTRRMIRSHFQSKDWTLTPANLGILSALKQINKSMFEKELKENISKFTADMYVSLYRDNFISTQYDSLYIKSAQNHLHKYSLKALNAFYDYFKEKNLFNTTPNLKEEFLYAAFTTNPAFFDKTLLEINKKLPHKSAITLHSIMMTARHAKRNNQKWSIKHFSLPVFERGLQDRWFTQYFITDTYDSIPHFQLILNAYSSDLEMRKIIERDLKQYGSVAAKAAYEKHVLLNTIDSQKVVSIEKPKFKI